MLKSLLPGVLAAGVLVALVTYPLYRQGPGAVLPEAPPADPAAQAPSQTRDQIAPPQAPQGADVPVRTATAADPVQQPPPPAGRNSLTDLPCDISLSARVKVAARVVLSLRANCAPSQGFTVEHAGLRFSGRTDDQGRYQVVVPALAEEAAFLFTFADGQTVAVRVPVPEVAFYRYAALQWRGDLPAALEVQEFGAAQNTSGHIRPGAPGGAEAAVSGRGGFLSVLGEAQLSDGYHAQVYSFPQRISRTQGVVRVRIALAVTADNCGQMVAAETLQPGALGLQKSGLRIQMPDCGQVGRAVVLNHPLRDMKILSDQRRASRL